MRLTLPAIPVLITLFLAAPATAQPVMLDPSFGSNGLQVLGSGSFVNVSKVAVTPSGGVLCLAWTVEEGHALHRFTSAGAVDPSFGENGMFHWPDSLRIREMSVMADGRIVVIGSVGNATDPAFVARFLPDGGMDASFGIGGVTTLDDFTNINYFEQFALSDNGSITIVGSGVSLDEDRAGLVVR